MPLSSVNRAFPWETELPEALFHEKTSNQTYDLLDIPVRSKNHNKCYEWFDITVEIVSKEWQVLSSILRSVEFYNRILWKQFDQK